MVESKIIIHNKSAEVIATRGTKSDSVASRINISGMRRPMFPMFCAAFCPDILDILNILNHQ
jgi:hypothetical protein